MNRTLGLVAVLALASCGGSKESGFATQTSAITSQVVRVRMWNPCDNRLYSGDGDWYYGGCKTECPSALTGIASSLASSVTEYYEWTDMVKCDDGTGPAVSLGSGYTLSFGRSNDQRFPSTPGDWARGLYKGECDENAAITGIATDQYEHTDCFLGICIDFIHLTAFGVLGARCTTLTSPPGFTAVATDCTPVDFHDCSVQEPTAPGCAWTGEDWDVGLLKGECAPGKYVKGIAHGSVGDGSARAVRILCCSASYVPIPG